MKKVIISVISTLLVLAFMVQMGWLQVIGINRFSFEKSDNTQNKLDFECASENNINYSFRTQGDYFYHYEDNEWKKIFITGVNIGATEPGLFPGDLTISYDTYLRWFKYIKEMNANGIPQWDEIYPCRDDLLHDMEQQELYVGKIEGKAAVAYVLNQECDDEYQNGMWLYPDANYYVIHRLCVSSHFQKQGKPPPPQEDGKKIMNET